MLHHTDSAGVVPSKAASPPANAPLFLSMTGSYRTVVRRFLDLFDRAGPIFESADIIDLVVTHILEDLPGERRTTAGSAIEDNGLFLIEILVVVWRVRVGAKFQHSA